MTAEMATDIRPRRPRGLPPAGPLADAAEAIVAAGPPGAVFAVAVGSNVYGGAAGRADPERGDAATIEHVGDLASVGKIATVFAAQMLCSRSVLSPSDTLGRVLGAVAGDHGAATLDQVLRHRGGFAPWAPLYLRASDGDPVRASLQVAPIAAPDQQYRYSDLGMQALGAVIERATGLALEAAVSELVLAPLGADSITPAGPGAAVFAGQRGDEIERAMVTTGSPYPVCAEGADSFAWRTEILRGEIGDGNAHHTFGGVAGHAGWFGDIAGLLALADALAEPERLGITDVGWRAERDPGQAAGIRVFHGAWGGHVRRFFGHPGFTGSFVAAAPAAGGLPAIRTALLANRLCGDAGLTGRDRVSAEVIWRRALAIADGEIG